MAGTESEFSDPAEFKIAPTLFFKYFHINGFAGTSLIHCTGFIYIFTVSPKPRFIVEFSKLFETEIKGKYFFCLAPILNCSFSNNYVKNI